jgi:hypothetical protein
MELADRKPNLDGPGTYRIRVPGRLDEHLSDWAEGMKVTVEQQGAGPPITTLTGPLVDQAALHGLLRRLYALGLPLIEVKWVGPE